MQSDYVAGVKLVGLTVSWTLCWCGRRQSMNIEDRFVISSRGIVGRDASALITSRLTGGEMSATTTTVTQMHDGPLQLKAQSYKVTERCTHGTLARCVYWFIAV